ncbi:ParA family protein [Gordonia effusa]|nr:ParA family protein [Gordonia effusa]
MPTDLYALAVAMKKGGVGKTTTAINLAYEFSMAGYRVLLLDLDPQTNATDGLGITIDDSDGTLYEVLTPARSDRMPLADVIKKSNSGVDVAPADDSMYKLDESGLGPGGENRLKVALATVADDYDIVVMDCPPSLGSLTISALAAATDVMAVVAPGGPDELKGLTRLAETVYEAQDLLNPSVDIRHVLLANYDGRSALAKDIRRNLQRDWADEYLGEISRTVRVGEAKARQVPVSVHRPDSYAAKDYHSATQTLINRISARQEGK